MKKTLEELIDILIELAKIVYALSDEARFTGNWQAGEVLSKLKALREALGEEGVGQGEEG